MQQDTFSTHSHQHMAATSFNENNNENQHNNHYIFDNQTSSNNNISFSNYDNTLMSSNHNIMQSYPPPLQPVPPINTNPNPIPPQSVSNTTKNTENHKLYQMFVEIANQFRGGYP